MIPPEQLLLGSAVALTAVAAVFDWRTGEIPDAVSTWPLLAAPLAHAGMAFARGTIHDAIQAAGFSVAGALLCALVPALLYRSNAIGGGDVKLLASVGAICRPYVGVEAEFYAFIVAAIVAPARLAYQGKLGKTLKNAFILLLNPLRPKAKRRPLDDELLTRVRFGPAIFAGTLCAALMHWRMQR